jgi:hypothetical protein
MAMSKKERRDKILEIIREAEGLPLGERIARYAQYHDAKAYGLLPAHDSKGLREFVDIHEIGYRRALTAGLDDKKAAQRIETVLRAAKRIGYQPLRYANPPPPP